MSPTAQTALAALAELLRYPSGDHAAAVPRCVASVAEFDPALAAALAPFAEALAPLSLEGREELYTSTFDLKPLCTLEVGWQLFGEEYNRGAFLVRCREMMRRHELSADGELADHLTCLLPLLARLDEATAARFVPACVMPAVDYMREAFSQAEKGTDPISAPAAPKLGPSPLGEPKAVPLSGNPYRHVLDAVAGCLGRLWMPLEEEVLRG